MGEMREERIDGVMGSVLGIRYSWKDVTEYNNEVNNSISDWGTRYRRYGLLYS